MKFCILCGSTVSVDSHHVWPQEFGGKDLPTVDLCSSCHQAIHRYSNNVSAREEFISTLKTTQAVILARNLFHFHDKAKTSGLSRDFVNLTIKIDKNLHERLKLASVTYSMSMNDLLNKLLSSALNR